MNPQDSQLTLILPRDKIGQIKALAAKLGCTPDDLVNEQYDRAKKDLAFQARVAAKAKEIESALMRGERS